MLCRHEEEGAKGVLRETSSNCTLFEMLYLIGLGLADPTDITVKGLNIVKQCDHLYLESYTSMMSSTSVLEMETFFGKTIIVADRELVEQGAEQILENAKESSVAFLVIGDPLGATTHADLVLRAKALGIPTQVVHNASILNAIGVTGLQLYSFGETVSIPFWTDNWKPDSFFEKICENKKRGLHTLCLLDIKVKEPNLESMMKGKIVYEAPRFMTVAQACQQLLKVLFEKKTENEILKEGDMAVGVARIGSQTQTIVACSLEKMMNQDLGDPLHSLVIPGNMHPLEEEFLNAFLI